MTSKFRIFQKPCLDKTLTILLMLPISDGVKVTAEPHPPCCHTSAPNHIVIVFPQLAGFVSRPPPTLGGTSSSGMAFPTLRSTTAATYFTELCQTGNSARAGNAASCVWFDSLANRSIKDISGGLTQRATLIQG